MPLSGSGAASGATAGSAFGPWGTVIGGLLGAFANQKKAPPIAPFTPTPTINPQQQQQSAISGNQSVLPSIDDLLSQSNKFQQGQASSLMESAVPGYGALSASITGSATQKAQNPYALPPEVQQNLQRIAAERGVSVGSQGQTQSFSALRDLGVNMLDYGNANFSQALQGLQTVTGVAPKVSPMSPLSFLLTPSQQIGVAGTDASITQANNQGAQSTAQGGYNVNAAATNFNNANMWQNLLQMLGGLNAQGALGGGS